MLKAIRRNLSIKLFLSYLFVIAVGGVVLLIGVRFALPAAFQRHMAPMMGGSMMGGMMGGTSVFQNFQSAINETLLWGVSVSILAAVLISLLVSRQVVSRVQSMTQASQYIAAGHYAQRVQAPHGLLDEQDELGTLAMSFNRMAEKLEQTESMRRQLIGDVSHELRTPLTAIKGSMEGLIDGVLPADAATFEQIQQEAARLERLVDDLQELSRVEARAYQLDLQSIQIADLINATVTRLKGQFEAKGVALQTDLPSELQPVEADHDRLNQVLTNLIGNALQYTPQGGKVTVRAAQVGDEVQVSVTDTGVGIANEHLAQIFDRFYRVDKSRSRAGGGSGIGLTIARFLVEAHGGRIRAESPGPGEGSTFTFTLPVAAPLQNA